MATKTQSKDNTIDRQDENRGQSNKLEDSPMMAHLLEGLKGRKDVGHYGRLVFAMVARHFMPEDKLVELLAKQPGQDEGRARAMVQQVISRDYNPPRRERILEWQAQQEFAICPDADDPNACNVYSDLRFPESVYENVNEFYEEQSESQA
jgi:hypothetical protein